MSATDPKKSSPATVRIDVGCHSVIRAVTSGLTDSPTAYAQTAGPSGVRQAAAADTSATTSARSRGLTWSWTSSSQARPSTAGARMNEPWRFAHRTVTTGTSHNARGCSRRIDTRTSTTAKQAMPNSCGRRPIAGAATTNAATTSRAAVRGVEAATPRDDEHGREDDAGQHRTQDDEPGPAADVLDQGQDHLGAPLLVDPWRPGGGERPRVDRRQRTRRDDLGTRAQLVREIDRGHRRDDGREHGQGDGQEQPESVQRHVGILAMPGAPRHRVESPNLPRQPATERCNHALDTSCASLPGVDRRRSTLSRDRLRTTHDPRSTAGAASS